MKSNWKLFKDDEEFFAEDIPESALEELSNGKGEDE